MPASPGVKCGFGLSCWLAKSLLSARWLPCVYLCCVFFPSSPLFLDNLVVFLLSTAKCLEVRGAKRRSYKKNNTFGTNNRRPHERWELKRVLWRSRKKYVNNSKEECLLWAHTQVSSGIRQRREPLFNFQPPCEVCGGCHDPWHAGAVACSGLCGMSTTHGSPLWHLETSPPPPTPTRRAPPKTPESQRGGTVCLTVPPLPQDE